MKGKRYSLLLLVVILSVFTVNSSLGQDRSSKSDSPAPQLDTPIGRPPDSTPVSTHEKFATFLAGEDFKSTLILQNFRPDSSITFRPSVIIKAGEVQLEPITVPAHSNTSLDISAVLRERGYKDTRGTVAIKFDFSSYGPGAAVVQMSDDKHHVYLNSYAQSTEEYWSDTQYDAVIWAPTQDTQGFISITNASTEAHIVSLTFSSDGHSERRSVQVPGRQTVTVDIDELLSRSRRHGGGIHVEYSRASTEEYPGAILVEGQLFNNKTGFSKNIHFLDKALPPTSTLRSHFLLLGEQPAEDNFPPNIFFHSVAAIRNIEDARITVVPKVKFLGSQGLQTVTLSSRTLNSHESTVIDFNDEQKAGRLPQGFTQGTLELTSDLDRPSIVAELYNFSQNGGYVVGSSFNSYPTRSTSSIWRTDGSFQTTIVVENTGKADDRLSLRLYSEHGLYSKSFPVSAGSLLKINLRELQEKAVRDDNGAILVDTSGIMSLVASQGIRSKLSFGKIIHSADLSEYIGLPANQCDYVSSIAMWVDTSGTMPFPVMKTYYWTQSGPVDENNFGTQSSNSSWAQISNNGSGDVVTLSVPDDGFVHQITLNPSQPTEDVTFCDACSAGDVTVSSTTLGAKTVNLLSSTCTVDPGTHQPTLVGGWGSPGCALSGTSPGFLLPSGGSCVVNGSKNCYQVTTPSCVQTFCPGDTREVDGSCTRFLDQFPVVSSTSPAGCSL